MAHTVEVDKDLCLSSGKCVADHPRAFAFDDDEIAEATPEAPSEPLEALLDAARNCPAEAIVVRDASGERIDPFG